MSMQHREAISRLQILIGHDLVPLSDVLGIPIKGPSGKVNKGWAGQTVERYLGLPINSSRSPNLGSWELKVIPARIDANNEIQIKETMAITMIDPVEVQRKSFEESHLFNKLNKVIVVIREHTDDNSRSVVLNCQSLHLKDSIYFDKVKEDYEEVQEALRQDTPLTGRMGTYIQPRTKGAGHGSTSRAFYARRSFLQTLFVADGLDPNHAKLTELTNKLNSVTPKETQ